MTSLFSLPRNFLLATIIILCLWGQGFSRNSSCGTLQAIKHIQEQPQQKYSAKTAYEPSICTTDDYYGQVFSRNTKHFQIFYTIQGPHKTKTAFVDSLAQSLERAWDFHIVKNKFLPPKGIQTSYHYQQPVDPALYPVEIIDIEMIRNAISVLGYEGCGGCFGLTYPISSENELLIDNDFKYASNESKEKGLLINGEKNCYYKMPDTELQNEAHQYSYANNWSKGIEIASIHELYHAIQLQYANVKDISKFWFEASATGAEEIAAPDVDDYFAYLPKLNYHMGRTLSEISEAYGAAVLYIYLNNHVEHNFDKSIWEGFKNNPKKKFDVQLQDYLSKKGLSSDSIFQDFSERLSFAGSRSKFVEADQLICEDEARWPDFNYAKKESFTPDTTDFAFKFYSGGSPDLNYYKGKASAILYKNDRASIMPIHNLGTLDSIQIALGSSDSLAWVFSHFGSGKELPVVQKEEISLRAFPTPWRGGVPLCFAPLPSEKNFIEIRSRRGDLILREPYNETTHCISENIIREKMVPGLYKYRIGKKGKAKDLLIIY